MYSKLYSKKSYLEYDIALMKLSNKIVYNKHVSPICLPESDDKIPDYYVSTGWGHTLS